jgi:hypothetical protein
MMKREVNNSRGNLEANNASMISNKAKPSQNNPSSVVPVVNQQPKNVAPFVSQ